MKPNNKITKLVFHLRGLSVSSDYSYFTLIKPKLYLCGGAIYSLFGEYPFTITIYLSKTPAKGFIPVTFSYAPGSIGFVFKQKCRRYKLSYDVCNYLKKHFIGLASSPYSHFYMKVEIFDSAGRKIKY
jgi:hypothetical protein